MEMTKWFLCPTRSAIVTRPVEGRAVMRMSMPATFAFMVLTTTFTSPATATPLSYSEAVSGDLIEVLPAATVFTLDVGVNTVSGTFGVNPVDFDSRGHVRVGRSPECRGIQHSEFRAWSERRRSLDCRLHLGFDGCTDDGRARARAGVVSLGRQRSDRRGRSPVAKPSQCSITSGTARSIKGETDPPSFGGPTSDR
jgi:hypothetical protein